jgi:hypothetical protein
MTTTQRTGQVLVLMALVGTTSSCLVTRGYFDHGVGQLRDDIRRQLTTAARLTPGDLRFDRLLTQAQGIAPGRFVDVSGNGSVSIKLSPCDNVVSAITATDSSEPDVPLKAIQDGIVETGKWLLDPKAAAPDTPFGDGVWVSAGIYRDQFEMRLGVSIPAFTFAGSNNRDSISFQAWRRTSTSTIDIAPKTAELTACCQRSDCGQYMVLSTHGLVRYGYRYTSLNIEANGSYAVYSANVHANAASGQFYSEKWTEIVVAGVPAQNVALEAICSFPQFLTLQKGVERTVDLHCPVAGLAFSDPVTSSTFSSATGVWAIKMKASGAPGTLHFLTVTANQRSARIPVVVTAVPPANDGPVTPPDRTDFFLPAM